MRSVRVVLRDPWVYVPSPGNDRLPVSSLSVRGAHLHGTLTLTIDDRPLPGLGYWGPSDVCVGMWARELAAAADALGAQPVARYVFDEGEQGQPAYEFSREGDDVFVSVLASELSDGEADPEWQRVPCKHADFQEAVAEFLRALREMLSTELGPEAARVLALWFGTR